MPWKNWRKSKVLQIALIFGCVQVKWESWNTILYFFLHIKTTEILYEYSACWTRETRTFYRSVTTVITETKLIQSNEHLSITYIGDQL